MKNTGVPLLVCLLSIGSLVRTLINVSSRIVTGGLGASCATAGCAVKTCFCSGAATAGRFELWARIVGTQSNNAAAQPARLKENLVQRLQIILGVFSCEQLFPAQSVWTPIAANGLRAILSRSHQVAM
jgi:hypothetical protein